MSVDFLFQLLEMELVYALIDYTFLLLPNKLPALLAW